MPISAISSNDENDDADNDLDDGGHDGDDGGHDGVGDSKYIEDTRCLFQPT